MSNDNIFLDGSDCTSDRVSDRVSAFLNVCEGCEHLSKNSSDAPCNACYIDADGEVTEYSSVSDEWEQLK